MEFFDRLRRQFGVPDAVREDNRKAVVATKVAQRANVELPADGDGRARRIAAIESIIDAVMAVAEDGGLDAQFAEVDAPDTAASDIARKPPPGVEDEFSVESTRDIAGLVAASLVKHVRQHPFDDA